MHEIGYLWLIQTYTLGSLYLSPAFRLDQLRNLCRQLRLPHPFLGVMKPKVEVTELDLREVSADELAAMIASDAPKGVRLDADLREEY